MQLSREIENLSHWTDDQLQHGWNNGFECRVKHGRNKGIITIRAARLGDAILAEASKRGLRIDTPRKYP